MLNDDKNQIMQSNHNRRKKKFQRPRCFATRGQKLTLDTRLAGGTGGNAGDSEILLTGVLGMVMLLTSIGVSTLLINSSSLICVGGGGGGGLEVLEVTDDAGRS